MERQLESPYDWYPSSSINASSFGGVYREDTNLDQITQYDDVEVLEGDLGSSNVIHELISDDYRFVFVVIQNTGDNDVLLKFDALTPSSSSGYSWYLGVNEIWATKIGQKTQKIYAKCISGTSKVSFMLGSDFTGGG